VSPDRQISHKHGSLPMPILRKIYGQSFAAGLSPTTTLYEALELFGPHAISEMHRRCCSGITTMAYSNERSKKPWGTNERLRKTAAFVVHVALLIATSARAQFVEGEVLVTPSMKIECTFRPAGPELSCDRFGPRHLRLVLGPSGVAQMFSVAADDECCGADNVLDFGMTWSQGPFTCHSARSGLICSREEHGFSIGKKVVMVY